jgi:hypothetical protein
MNHLRNAPNVSEVHGTQLARMQFPLTAQCELTCSNDAAPDLRLRPAKAHRLIPLAHQSIILANEPHSGLRVCGRKLSIADAAVHGVTLGREPPIATNAGWHSFSGLFTIDRESSWP